MGTGWEMSGMKGGRGDEGGIVPVFASLFGGWGEILPQIFPISAKPNQIISIKSDIMLYSTQSWDPASSSPSIRQRIITKLE